MSSADSFQAMVPGILSEYSAALKESELPFAEAAVQRSQFSDLAEGILLECVSVLRESLLQVTGSPTAGTDGDVIGLGRLWEQQGIPFTTVISAMQLLWQRAVPAMHHAFGTVPPVLITVIDALQVSMITRLRDISMGYSYGAAGLAAERFPDELDSTVTIAGSSTLLTLREAEVLTGVARAMSNREIGRELEITEGTVKRHLSNIFGKLGATSRVDALNKAGLELSSIGTSARGHDGARDMRILRIH